MVSLTMLYAHVYSSFLFRNALLMLLFIVDITSCIICTSILFTIIDISQIPGQRRLLSPTTRVYNYFTNTYWHIIPALDASYSHLARYTLVLKIVPVRCFFFVGVRIPFS